jgi:hypothetical protein
MSLIPGATGTPSSFPDGFQVAGNGSPATPAFTFLSPSNNTGMYSPGDDQIAFSSNGVRSLLVGSSGSFTAGPESGSVQVSHTIYGYSSLFTWGNGILNLSNRNGSNAVTIVMANNTTKFASWSSSNTFPWAVQDSSGNDLGYMSSSGAVTLGPNGSASFSSQAATGIYRNCYVAGSSGRNNRYDSNLIGGAIELQANGDDTSACIVFWANKDLDTTTTGASAIAVALPTGAWVFGPNNGTGFAMLAATPVSTVVANSTVGIYSNCRTTSGVRDGRAESTYTGGAIECQANAADTTGVIYFYANKDNDGVDTTAETVGQINALGAWTLGNTAKIGSSDYAGQLLVGRTNGTAIPVGYVGQTLLSKYTAYTNHSATGVWNADASVALTPGVWVLYGCVTHNLNGATATAFQMAVTSSATAAVSLDDENYRESALPTSAFNLSSSVSGLYVNVTTNTTYYLNRRAFYSAGTPRHTGMLRAIRIA